MTARIDFLHSPPGFEPNTTFVLEPIEGASGLFRLTAAHNDVLRLFVIDASVYLPDYTPTLNDEQSGALGLQRADDALVLVITTPDATGTTANLLAPLVVNSQTGRALQVILDDDRWPLRYALNAQSA